MIDKWVLVDIEKYVAQRNRVVLLDPLGQCDYLIPHIEDKGYVVLKTDSTKREEWQRVKEELFLRYDAEKKHRSDKVVFYVTRPQTEMSFLFDYCFTHGCVDLTHPEEWLKKKLFQHTGLQVNMDSSKLKTAAKSSIGKDLSWWKKILQSLEEIVSVKEELIPFLGDPNGYVQKMDQEVWKMFEVKLFEIINQPVRNILPKTLAEEIVKKLFTQLINNDINRQLLDIYYKWLDSHTYIEALRGYISGYKLDDRIDIWNVHPDHCFEAIDLQQLAQITLNFRDKSYVKEKLKKIKQRVKSQKAARFVPSWWSDVITLFEFDSRPLSNCNTLAAVTRFYTGEFHLADRAIRNLYVHFIQDESIMKPVQEHYESINYELLKHWYEVAGEYKSNQQGYLPKLLSRAIPGTAVIVGDGVRYEIAAYVALQLQNYCKVETEYMLADMPSETAHNMSALYAGNHEVIPVHKDREKRLTEITRKEITYLNLEALYPGTKADYLVLTYKDIDSAGEKMQMGSLKLFNEFEKVLIEKIRSLLNMGYKEVHLVTDHGFVLTGLLDESGKINPTATGKKDIHERFIRTVDKQPQTDWLMFERPFADYKYVYAAKSHRPFKSTGVYGFSHGGFTPQEIIIPNFVFKKSTTDLHGLTVSIINKKELAEITGEVFGLKIGASGKADELFSASRNVQILLYANNVKYSSSDIFKIEPDMVQPKEFSFEGNNEILAVLTDAATQEQLDSVKIKKSNMRDLGGLF